MDVIHEPAPTAAATGAARLFPAELVMNTMFNCPLWPSAAMDPIVLVNFMTGLNKPTHTFTAYMLCQQSLVHQFPQLTQPCGAHLEVATLYRHLAFHAQVRIGEISQWIDQLAKTAKIDISSVPQTCELLYEWADELDWIVSTHPDRTAALRMWLRRLTRSKMKVLATADPSTLDASLPELDALYLRRAEEARHVHGIWLQTRRCVADISERVQVKPLEPDSYGEAHWNEQHSKSPEGFPAMRSTYGRLDYFRTESKYPPPIN